MTAREDDSRGELALFLRDELFQAKRQIPKVGSADYPTKWDQHHAKLNELLDDYWACEA